MTDQPAATPETAAERDRLLELNRKLIKTLRLISKARRFINGMVFSPDPDHLAFARDTIDVAQAALDGVARDEARKP